MSINFFNISGNSNNLIPARNPNAISGSEFISQNINLVGPERESNILNEILSGNIPDFLRAFYPITITNGNNSITYLVTLDVLSIGFNDDFCRILMNPHTAQAIANKYDCTLPTTKIVDDIWKAAINKLEPKPWGPPYDGDMIKTYRLPIHNKTIQDQLVGKDPAGIISGHKKDIVLTNYLFPNNTNKKVAIYGWIQLNGYPIQGLNYFSHDDNYEDYSHGVRLIANDCLVNNNLMRIQDVFQHPTYSKLISNEGPLKFLKY